MISFLRVCLWTGLLLFLLAVLGACTFINRFTRLAGELFGILIAMLFMQEAIRVSKKAFFIQLYLQLYTSIYISLHFFRALWMNLVSREEQIQNQLSFNLLGCLQMECSVWFCLLDFCILHWRAEKQGLGYLVLVRNLSVHSNGESENQKSGIKVIYFSKHEPHQHRYPCDCRMVTRIYSRLRCSSDGSCVDLYIIHTLEKCSSRDTKTSC